MPLISIDHTIVYDWDDKTQVSPRSSRSPRSHQFWWGYSMLCPSFSRFLIVTWGPMGQNFISIHKQCQESIGLLGKIRVPLTYWKGIITIYYWNSQIAINTPVEPIRNQLTLKFFPDPSKDGPMVLETPKTAKTHKYNFWQYYISSMVVIQNHNSDTKTMVMFDSIVSLYHPFFPCLGPQILPLPMVKCHTWAAMALAGRWKRGDSPCETTRVAQCICGSAETGSAPKHPGISQKISCNLQETAQ